MRVRNWKKHQHFKDRRPPWIKLHREILDQRDINSISDCSFRVLVNLWLLASEDEEKSGNLPSIADCAFRLRCEESRIINALQELSPWIEFDDIDVISDRYQNGPPETETETETDTPTQSVGAHLIPSDWMPNESVADLSKRHHVSESDVMTVIEEFREYWTASGRRQKNWQLVWVKNPVAKGRFHSIAKRSKGNGSAPADYGRGGI